METSKHCQDLKGAQGNQGIIGNCSGGTRSNGLKMKEGKFG